MPEIDFDVIEQAIDDLTGAGASLILGDEVEHGEPAKPALVIEQVPARHCLAREAEKRIQPGRIAASEDGMRLGLRDDGGDLGTKG